MECAHILSSSWSPEVGRLSATDWPSRAWQSDRSGVRLREGAREVAQMPLSELWSMRFAPVGSVVHRRWSIEMYGRLQFAATYLYRGKFPRTDHWLREQAWTTLWTTWHESPPTRASAFADDDAIIAYINRSIINAMLTQLRRRRQRLLRRR